MVDIISKENSNFNLNTIYTQISDLRKHKDYRERLSQIPRIYITRENEKNLNSMVEAKADSTYGQTKHREEEFYDQFAIFLKDNLNECTLAKAMRNSRFQVKWETPDEHMTSDCIGIEMLAPYFN